MAKGRFFVLIAREKERKITGHSFLQIGENVNFAMDQARKNVGCAVEKVHFDLKLLDYAG